MNLGGGQPADRVCFVGEDLYSQPPMGRLDLSVPEGVERPRRTRNEREPEAGGDADDVKCDDGVRRGQLMDRIIRGKPDDQRTPELVLQRESRKGPIALLDLLSAPGADLDADVFAFVDDDAISTGLGQ